MGEVLKLGTAVLIGVLATVLYREQSSSNGISLSELKSTVDELTGQLESIASSRQESLVRPSRSLYYSAVSTERVKKIDSGKMLFKKDSYDFAIVSDLDLQSRHPEKFLWHSIMKMGRLSPKNDGYSIEWTDTHRLESKTATKNRSMELSELVQYDHLLLALCDITGLMFKISIKNGKRKVLQRHALADGDGNSNKAFKSEWATVKDGALWVGSTGKEWNTLPPDPPAIVHEDTQWVKVIDHNGFISNVDWRNVYTALRTVTNTTYPGYLWHEAVIWDPRIERWLFLPRKASEAGPYHPDTDVRMGTNLLIVCSEDFSSIEVLQVGPVEELFGFSGLRKIPGTDRYLALKTLENGDVTKTKICVFDLSGMYEVIEEINDVKFEGVEFLH